MMICDRRCEPCSGCMADVPPVPAGKCGWCGGPLYEDGRFDIGEEIIICPKCFLEHLEDYKEDCRVKRSW